MIIKSLNGGHPFETLIGNIFPCFEMYENINYLFPFKSKEELYSDNVNFKISSHHRYDEMALIVYTIMRENNYPFYWDFSNTTLKNGKEILHKLLTKKYLPNNLNKIEK